MDEGEIRTIHDAFGWMEVTNGGQGEEEGSCCDVSYAVTLTLHCVCAGRSTRLSLTLVNHVFFRHHRRGGHVFLGYT